MEAFEHVVKVFLEGQGYAVTNNIKFPITREIVKKDGRRENQTHGYEVDIVAAKGTELLLASVKSFLGSRGVTRQGFSGLADPSKPTDFGAYRMFNDRDVRDGILRQASSRYGYSTRDIKWALFVGRFLSRDEDAIRGHLAQAGIRVFGIAEIVQGLRLVAISSTYVDDPVVVTLKCLAEAGVLKHPTQAEIESWSS